ncbi:MAG: hypothetical protein HBSIN02_04340 [Bacteroidia bacterium]|nr:MAG: hypothetical protein HBSIN02_04340 [Bacteroidia bacterium]
METPETAASPDSMGTRIANVFASPSEAFQGLDTNPPRSLHWVIPFILILALGVFSVYLIFSTESLRDQIYDLQARQFEKAVAEGQMTQQQADQIRDRMEQTGLGLFMVFGAIPIVLFTAAYFFLGALFLWLASKIVFKTQLKYGKYLEMYGLASWIGVLGSLVTLVMFLGLNSIFATPSLGLLYLDSFDPTNTMHKLAGAFNVFSVWQAVVIGMGLSAFSRQPSGKGIAVALVLWAIWLAVGVPLGLIR